MIELSLAAPAALTPQDAPGLILKVLAVLGGAVLGGLLVGLAGRLLTRTLTTRPLPAWATRVLRVGGGAAAGWLVALWVFSEGGSGFGGSGGGRPGSSGESGERDRRAEEPKDKKDDTPPSEETKELRVEVLGPMALKALNRPAEGPQVYRLAEGDAHNLYDLDGLKKRLGERRKQNRNLRVVVVLYRDSPAEIVPVVKELKEWLDDEKIALQVQKPAETSPELRGR